MDESDFSSGCRLAPYHPHDADRIPTGKRLPEPPLAQLENENVESRIDLDDRADESGPLRRDLVDKLRESAPRWESVDSTFPAR